MKINLESAVAYINTLYSSDEANRRDYIEATKLRKFGTVVDSDVSRMMKLLIRLARPQRILEIGTSIGYSTLSMGSIVKEYGGKIITIEYDEQSAKQAIKNFKLAGIAELIEVKIGDAMEIVPAIEGGFDLIFQDVGDKGLYPILLNHLVNLLNPGGILLAEDALLPFVNIDTSKLNNFNQERWDNRKKSLEEFNMMIASCPYLESTLLPIGDGLTMAIKIS